VARKAGIPKSYVYQAQLRGASPRGEIAIAEFIEIDPRKLWPERWERPTAVREVWLLKNAEKLQAWRSNRLEDVGR
jgi:lambda repressor-like predicted transcriptional regulator